MSTTGTTSHTDKALRAHRTRFRINGAQGSKMLKTMLATMEREEEALLLALDKVGCDTPTSMLLNMRTAVRMLVEGES